jgi:hypothetical protein
MSTKSFSGIIKRIALPVTIFLPLTALGSPRPFILLPGLVTASSYPHIRAVSYEAFGIHCRTLE